MEPIKNFDILTDSDREAIKFINIKNKFDEGIKAKEMIKAQSRAMLGDEEATDAIDAKLNSMTEDEIKALSDDDIDAIFSIGDEEVKLVNREIDRDIDIKRDFLLFRKRAIDTFAYIDEETRKLNEDLAESREEFEKLTNEFDTMSDVIMNRLTERLETSEDEEEKTKIRKIMTEVDNAFSLDNIKKYLSNEVKRRSIYSIYGIEAKTRKVFNKYEKNIKYFGISENILKYGNIEKAFLPEEYTKRPNIFAVIFISFVADMKQDEHDKTQGVFISQFMVNLKDLCYGKMNNEKKEKFINNIKEVVAMIER